MSDGYLKKPLVRNFLSALTITILSFILLNLTFLFDFVFQSLIRKLLMNDQWFPPAMHLLFVFVIALISWKILSSKLNILIKAAFITVPLAVVYVTIGIFTYPYPIIANSLGGLFGISCFFYLRRTKQRWFYYFSLILISLVLFIGGLLGMEI